MFAFLQAKNFLCKGARAILLWRKNLDLFIASKLPFLGAGGTFLNNVSKEKILFKLSEGTEFVYGGLDNEVTSKVKVQPTLLSPASETNFFRRRVQNIFALEVKTRRVCMTCNLVLTLFC